MTRARCLTNADSFWFADDEIFQINHRANEMHVCTEFDKRWRYLLSSMGNSLVIVATGDLKVAKDREETYIRAKDRGRFDRFQHRSPSGLVFISPSQTPDLSLPSRSCVSYVRANSISRDSFRSGATYKLFPNRSTFLASCFSWRGRVTPKKRRQLIVRRHAEFQLDVYTRSIVSKTAPPFLSRFSQSTRPPARILVMK